MGMMVILITNEWNPIVAG